jgi:hypothetical protein
MLVNLHLSKLLLAQAMQLSVTDKVFGHRPNSAAELA